MKHRAVVALLLAIGCSKHYGIIVDIDPGCAVGDEGLVVVVSIDGRTAKSAPIDQAFVAGGHRVLILPPDGARQVELRVDDATGTTVAGPLYIPIVGHALDDRQRLEIPGDGSWCERDGTEAMIDLSEVDASEDYSSEVDATEVDAAQVDSSEIDASEVDLSEVDAAEADASWIDDLAAAPDSPATNDLEIPDDL